jgi:uncharacterized protein HemX
MAKSLNDKLPLYSPPESVWENIEQGLREVPLQEALNQLPIYEPPVQTWFDIAAQLPQPRRNWWRYAAAAVVVLAVGIGGYLTMSPTNENATIAYSQEKLNPKAAVTANETIDRQYAHLQALCQEQITVCEKPEFKTLKKELDDLTAASNQLKEALGRYNTDATLSAQLSEIEQERADILRKLNERIL